MKTTALLLSIACLMAWVGDMSYSDALSEDAHYRANVCAGIWPPYRGEVDCPTEIFKHEITHR